MKTLDNGQLEMSAEESSNLLRDLKTDYSKMREFQYEARRRWNKMELYVEGKQAFDNKSRTFVGHEIAGARSPSGNVDEEMLLVNDIRRIHLSNMQRMTNYTIQPNVIPDSKDPKDKAGARFGKIALADMFRRNGEERLKKRIARILGVYGTCFLKVYFDPTKGSYIGKIKMDNFGRSYVDEQDTEPEGEVVIEAVSPRNVLLPKFCQDLDKADKLTEVRVETVDWIWRRFKKRIDPEDIKFDQYDGPIYADTTKDSVEVSRGSVENSAVLKTTYYRPCPRFPQGAIFVFTEKHLLWSSTLTEYYDDLPWAVCEMIFDDQSVLGSSLIWDLIPLQDGVNEVITAMVRHVKMYGDLQLWIPDTAGLDQEKISNATGDHTIYKGDKAPQFKQPPELQQTHYNVYNLLFQKEQSLGAAHDIARTQRALSGNAIANLQEIDDTILRPALNSVEEALQKTSHMALKIMADFYTSNRLIKMSGMQGWQIEKNFRGEMLGGNFHATISLMKGLSSNLVLRREQIESHFEKGLIDRDEARIYLEFGNTDELLENIQKEHEVADTIVKGIAEFPENYTETLVTGPDGRPQRKWVCKLVPHTFDNHQLIVQKLITFERENFDEQKPEVKEALEWRREWHQKFLAAMATPGLPGRGPVPESMGQPPFERPLPGEGAQGQGNLPGKKAGADSVQNPVQQPPREQIPNPGATGHQR